MPQSLPIVAQFAMDEYFQSFKSSGQFFDLDDFIFHCGATLSDIYQQEYRAKYAELRAFKQEEVVPFPADWLLTQKLKVERKDNQTYVELTEPVMSLSSWDNQTVGVQDVTGVRPRDVIFERTSLNTLWQQKHLPFTNRIFWYTESATRIIFVKKGGCNVHEVNVFYIPAISNSMLVPDGLVKIVIDQTVGTMKQLAQATIEKKAIDGQGQNKALETEMNKMALK